MNRILFLGSIPVFFLCSGVLVHATELTSANYSLQTQGVGEVEGNTLTSANYSVVPKNALSYTYGTSSTGGGDGGGNGGEDTDEGTSQTGSRSTRIDRKISDNLPEVIVGTQRENIEGRHNSLPPILRDKVLNEEYVPGTVKNDNLAEVNHIKPLKKRTDWFSASAIGGWIDGQFGDFFAERGARIVLFIGVLLFLFVIRTYTAIGKKYRPF